MSVVVGRMAIMFGPPDSPDPKVFMAEIDKLVRGYSEEVQHKAADLLIRQSNWWPKPNEIVVACADAQEMLHSTRKAA